MPECPAVGVDRDDAQPVEGVEDDDGDESGLNEADEGHLVRGNNLVVCLGGDANQGRVEYVNEKEEEDRDSGGAMREPHPHARLAAIQTHTGGQRGPLT